MCFHSPAKTGNVCIRSVPTSAPLFFFLLWSAVVLNTLVVGFARCGLFCCVACNENLIERLKAFHQSGCLWSLQYPGFAWFNEFNWRSFFYFYFFFTKSLSVIKQSKREFLFCKVELPLSVDLKFTNHLRHRKVDHGGETSATRCFGCLDGDFTVSFSGFAAHFSLFNCLWMTSSLNVSDSFDISHLLCWVFFRWKSASCHHLPYFDCPARSSSWVFQWFQRSTTSPPPGSLTSGLPPL